MAKVSKLRSLLAVGGEGFASALIETNGTARGSTKFTGEGVPVFETECRVDEVDRDDDEGSVLAQFRVLS